MSSVDVAERIREVVRAVSGDEVWLKPEDHNKLVQDWIAQRKAVEYQEVDWKADYLRIAPKAWETRLKTDSTLKFKEKLVHPHLPKKHSESKGASPANSYNSDKHSNQSVKDKDNKGGRKTEK